MKPVFQTRYVDPDDPCTAGNCFTACLASILNLPIWSVPNFVPDCGDDWFHEFFDWLPSQGLKFSGNLSLIKRGDGGPRDERIENFLNTYEGLNGHYIVVGESPRSYVNGTHAVVFSKGKMVHDPHKDGTGLVRLFDAFLIEKDI